MRDAGYETTKFETEDKTVNWLEQIHSVLESRNSNHGLKAKLEILFRTDPEGVELLDDTLDKYQILDGKNLQVVFDYDGDAIVELLGEIIIEKFDQREQETGEVAYKIDRDKIGDRKSGFIQALSRLV